jgi:hypothetical protein
MQAVINRLAKDHMDGLYCIPIRFAAGAGVGLKPS